MPNGRAVPCERTHVLVVGSGVAGLRAAIEASASCDVLVTTKGEAFSGSTGRAQGGIAVALGSHDTPELHLQDTLDAGDGLCEEEAVRILVEEGVEVVRELIDWGARFDREIASAGGEGAGGERARSEETLAFGVEGAHKIRRIIHAMGDATGEEVERTLLEHAAGCPRLRIAERHFAVDLLVEDGRCVGALMLTPDGRKVIHADAVVLATGGCGQLYEDTTNPPGASGDGMAMAYRAGCTLRDLEFVQFHPTALYAPGPTKFLISEAVRGEAGILRNVRGEAFMSRYHEMGDLAPRDVASRAIVDQMYRTGSDFVYLDMTGIDPGLSARRFPTITEYCQRELGLDVTKQPIPVRPAAHFAMGGVLTDTHARTEIEGLFACGEVASVGVHGANRLASNSLLEGLVYGRRAGRGAAACRGALEGKRPASVTAVCDPTARREADELAAAIPALRKVMENRVGIVRCAESLTDARRFVEALPLPDAAATESPHQLEAVNMVTVARLLVQCALAREESRGAHFRSDFPERDDVHWRRHSLVRKESE